MVMCFNNEDFGFTDKALFERAQFCGPIVRHEIRIRKADVKRERQRIEIARSMHKHETEQADESNSFTRFIDAYVEQCVCRVERAAALLLFWENCLKVNF